MKGLIILIYNIMEWFISTMYVWWKVLAAHTQSSSSETMKVSSNGIFFNRRRGDLKKVIHQKLCEVLKEKEMHKMTAETWICH